MKFDPHRHHRRSIRLDGYDYAAPGAYYLTILVRNRKQILSTITAGKVELLPAGVLAALTWQRLPHYFPRLQLDAFVFMPDHMHAIVSLHGKPEPHRANSSARSIGTRPGSIAAIVQNFKSVATRRINHMDGTPGRRVWQEDYYEHIIRDEADLVRIRRYIQTNPLRW